MGIWGNCRTPPSLRLCDRVRETDGQTDRCRRLEGTQLGEAQAWDRVSEVKDLRRHLLSWSCKCTVST